MSNLTWKLNSLFWVILSQNLCKFCYSFWPILCPAKAAFDNNKTTAKNSWKFVITWPVSLLSLVDTNNNSSGWIWPKLHFFLFQAVLAHFLAPKYSLKVFTKKTKLNLFQNPILNYFPLRPKLFLKFLHDETFPPAVLCLCLCSQHTPPRTTRISGLKSKVLKWPFFA